MRRLCVASSYYHRFKGNSIKAFGLKTLSEKSERVFLLLTRIDYASSIDSMNTLIQIFVNMGYITDCQLKELVEYFPHTKVVIQWGRMKRERLPAWEAIERMEKVEAEDTDYVRSVFLWSQDMDKLREVFHVAN